jgi:hypothetical protein
MNTEKDQEEKNKYEHNLEKELILLLVNMKYKKTLKYEIKTEINNKIHEINELPKIKKRNYNQKIELKNICDVNGKRIDIFNDIIFKLLSTLMISILCVEHKYLIKTYICIFIVQSINISGDTLKSGETPRETFENLKIPKDELYNVFEPKPNHNQINIILLLSQMNPLITFFIKILTLTQKKELKYNIYLTTPGDGLYKKNYKENFHEYIDLDNDLHKNIPYYILFNLTIKQIIQLQLYYLEMFGIINENILHILVFNKMLELDDDFNNVILIDLLKKKRYNLYYIGDDNKDVLGYTFGIKVLNNKVEEVISNIEESNTFNIFMGAGNANKPGGGLKLPELMQNKKIKYNKSKFAQEESLVDSILINSKGGEYNIDDIMKLIESHVNALNRIINIYNNFK